MPYVQAETVIQTETKYIRYVKKYYTHDHHPKNVRRERSGLPTKEAQKKLNAKNREIELWLRIEANFRPGDSHTVLQYCRDQQPANIAEAEKDLNAAINLTRQRCKRAGIPLRWIAVTETKGKKGPLFHHHVLINREAQETFWGAWDQVMGKKSKLGKCSSSRLDSRDSHRGLAAYLLKHSERTMEEWRALGVEKKQRWRASRNLVIPKTTRRVIRSNQWSKTPRPSKGRRLLKNANGDAWETGVNDVTGWPWQEYTEVGPGGCDPPASASRT